MQANPQSYPHLQQNVATLPGLQPQQTHNYGGRPVIPIHGAPGQPRPHYPQTSGGYGSVPHARPAQLASNQPSMAQSYAHTVNNQLQTPLDLQFVQSGVLQKQGEHSSIKTPVGQEAGLPSQSAVEKVLNTRTDPDRVKAIKSEPGMSYEQELSGVANDQNRQTEPANMGTGSELHGGKDLPGGPSTELIRVKEEPATYPLEPSANGKSVHPVNQSDRNGDTHDEESESQKSQKALFHKSGNESLQANRAVSPLSGSKSDNFQNVNSEGSHQTSVSARDQLQLYNHEQHMHHYGPSINQQRSAGPQISQSVPSRSEVPLRPPAQVRPQGQGLLPQPRNPMNPNDQLQAPSFGGGPGYFGAPHGPPFTAVDQRDGIMGRAPQHGSEGQFGVPHFTGPVEAEMIQSQKLNRFDGGQPNLPGSFGRDPSGPSLSGEPSSFRMDGGAGLGSSVRSQDEKFKTLPTDHLKPFPKDSHWPLDQGEFGCCNQFPAPVLFIQHFWRIF